MVRLNFSRTKSERALSYPADAHKCELMGRAETSSTIVAAASRCLSVARRVLYRICCRRRLPSKHQFKQNSCRRANEDPALVELDKIHQRISDAERRQLVAIAVVTAEPEADVINRLAAPVDAPAASGDDVHDRFAVGVEPIARKGERRSVTRRQVEHRLKKISRSFEVAGAQCCVIELDWRFANGVHVVNVFH